MKPEDYTYAVCQQNTPATSYGIAKQLGFTKEQVSPSIYADFIGDTGSASVLIGLAKVLDVAKPGEKIFVISYGADPAQVVAGLEANPQWQALRAVQAGQLYGFAADLFSWDQPDPRWILGTTWLASKIHPDRLEELDLLDEVSQFFGQMYGMDEASVQEQIVPLLKGDVP